MNGVVILEIPKNCYECKLQVHNPVGEHICAITHNSADHCASRSDLCPIRKLPSKKSPSKLPPMADMPNQYTNYEKGFNACIDQIIRG